MKSCIDDSPNVLAGLATALVRDEKGENMKGPAGSSLDTLANFRN
jgi:hypothetical protein